MGKEVLKDALRCLTGERDCNICYYNDLAEERDTCCINVISEEALEYIEELERKLKEFVERLKCITCEMYLKEQLHRCIDETLKEVIE